MLDKTLTKSRDTMPNIAVFNLTVRQIDALKLPKHSGSMLRGAFGHALRELCCITNLPDCSQCPLNQACRYTYIFETQLLDIANRQKASNPYIIIPPKIHQTNIKPTQIWRFGVVLLGEAIKDYVLILKAWEQALRIGLGSGEERACGELIKVGNQAQTVFDKKTNPFNLADWQIKRIIKPPSISKLSKITLHFLTPFRLQQEGKIAFHKNQLVPKNLLINLYNRIQQCNQQHDSETKWQTCYGLFSEFLADIEQLTMRVEVEPEKVIRRSSRQNQKIQLFGLSGDIQLIASSEILERLLPLLWIGQYLHVGKSTTLGLGQYQLQIFQSS